MLRPALVQAGWEGSLGSVWGQKGEGCVSRRLVA